VKKCIGLYWAGKYYIKVCGIDCGPPYDVHFETRHTDELSPLARQFGAQHTWVDEVVHYQLTLTSLKLVCKLAAAQGCGKVDLSKPWSEKAEEAGTEVHLDWASTAVYYAAAGRRGPTADRST
jgi:hypothetical protein